MFFCALITLLTNATDTNRNNHRWKFSNMIFDVSAISSVRGTEHRKTEWLFKIYV